MDYAASILAGNRLALARTLSLVENDHPEGRQALGALFSHTGNAHLIGVTGAPGSGKSSLVNQIARAYRSPGSGGQPRRVGIVAVDPTSPFSGGAFLGDRVRMRDLAGDPGVFIRSMASRGSLGGLAAATAAVVQVMDAAGFEVILIETVGAGQAEVDIARLAHTTLVVETPGMGDDIQAIKAGILEIADILVINKADRPGVENIERALQNMLELARPQARHFHTNGLNADKASNPGTAGDPPAAWLPPIQRTVATEGQGIPELMRAIARHQAHLHSTGEWQQRDRQRLSAELDLLVREMLAARWRAELPKERLQNILDELTSRRLSPYQAAMMLLESNGGRT